MEGDTHSIGMVKTMVAGETLWLHPFKAAFWEREKILLLADLHLGKAAHFRREGIPVPSDVSNANWDRLIGLLLDFQPERVLLLGDLFHSDYNREWEDLCRLTAQFQDVSFELVPGNHDILPERHYAEARLLLHDETLELGPFLFSHHPQDLIPESLYNLAGHVHPCVFLRGNGRQRARLACFYFGLQQGILPAFGAFTGMGKIKPRTGEQVFVVADDGVVEV